MAALRVGFTSLSTIAITQVAPGVGDDLLVSEVEMVLKGERPFSPSRALLQVTGANLFPFDEAYHVYGNSLVIAINGEKYVVVGVNGNQLEVESMSMGCSVHPEVFDAKVDHGAGDRDELSPRQRRRRDRARGGGVPGAQGDTASMEGLGWRWDHHNPRRYKSTE